jgi:hypothetical protein
MLKANKIFRFDDVCINADMDLINKMTDFLVNKFPDCTVIWGVSSLLHDMSNEKSDISKQRIFPKILNAHSDHRVFYNVDIAGLPEFNKNAVIASHGLIHVDHRLLDKSAQEMSILVSASLVKSKIFIPPFNKWNKYTEEICKEHNIELIKFEDGWLCMEYNTYYDDQILWYLHAREFTFDNFKKWFNTK